MGREIRTRPKSELRLLVEVAQSAAAPGRTLIARRNKHEQSSSTVKQRAADRVQKRQHVVDLRTTSSHTVRACMRPPTSHHTTDVPHSPSL